jgi:hypothetical protein
VVGAVWPALRHGRRSVGYEGLTLLLSVYLLQRGKGHALVEQYHHGHGAGEARAH